MRLLSGTALALSCLSCSTVTPNHVKDIQPSYDDSTPSQYDAHNSGLIQILSDDHDQTTGALITPNALIYYNNLIADYAIQFETEYKAKVSKNDGITPYIDMYGNELSKIDAQHFDYFVRLSQWSHDRKPSDTTWMKIKEVVK